MIGACLAVALSVAKANGVAVDQQIEARMAATCRTMAAVKARAITEDRDGRLSGCTALASVRYGLPHDALPAILQNEAGWLGAAVVNKDRSIDRGPYQLNSQWDDSWRRIFRLPSLRAAVEAISYDPCLNAEGAAIILARCIRDKGSLYAGLGCYASPTPALAHAYAGKIIGNAKRLAVSYN